MLWDTIIEYPAVNYSNSTLLDCISTYHKGAERRQECCRMMLITEGELYIFLCLRGWNDESISKISALNKLRIMYPISAFPDNVIMVILALFSVIRDINTQNVIVIPHFKYMKRVSIYDVLCRLLHPHDINRPLSTYVCILNG